MAVNLIPMRTGLSLKLNTGNNPNTGAIIIRTCSLGRMKPNPELEAVMSIVETLTPLMAHPLVRVEYQEVGVLDAA